MDTTLIALAKGWQEIIDLMAQIIDVPAGLIQRFDNDQIEIVVTSATNGNPFDAGGIEPLIAAESFCDNVIRNKKMLKVPNALNDNYWRNTKEINLGMISYLGYPILWPSGNPFGTICVLDNKENHYKREYELLIEKFKDLIERELEIIEKNQALRLVTELDSFTRILNRHTFFEKATVELNRSIRHQHDYSLLLLDLDEFKTINDTFGHQAGDEVLLKFTEITQQQIRASDLFGRYGGEEFILALPETDYFSAKLLASRIREAIERQPVFYENKSISFTVSIGVSVITGDTEVSSMLGRADQALYRAKKSGRNKVE